MSISPEIFSILSGGVATSVVVQVLYDTLIKKKSKKETLEHRINTLTSSLKSATSLINQIQSEIEYRQELAEKLQKDVETYKTIVKLKESEVDAVAQVFRGELKKEGKKSFLLSIGLNTFFFTLGAILTLVLSK